MLTVVVVRVEPVTQKYALPVATAENSLLPARTLRAVTWIFVWWHRPGWCTNTRQRRHCGYRCCDVLYVWTYDAEKEHIALLVARGAAAGSAQQTRKSTVRVEVENSTRVGGTFRPEGGHTAASSCVCFSGTAAVVAIASSWGRRGRKMRRCHLFKLQSAKTREPPRYRVP
ncbi:unnamed protein product [Ectocarpus sp. CCAP 1310/34]|nr:unnamed protein product [Ectocarpus sp. CCAP 1310/34]